MVCSGIGCVLAIPLMHSYMPSIFTTYIWQTQTLTDSCSKHLFDLALTLNGDKTIYVYCTSQCAYMYTCVSVGVGSNFILGEPNIIYSDLHVLHVQMVQIEMKSQA